MCYRVRVSAGKKVREGHENVVRMPWVDPERVGGFGIGSDLTWNAAIHLAVNPSDTMTVVLGYHVQNVDYEDGSGLGRFIYDMEISGPQLGVAFHF